MFYNDAKNTTIITKPSSTLSLFPMTMKYFLRVRLVCDVSLAPRQQEFDSRGARSPAGAATGFLAINVYCFRSSHLNRYRQCHALSSLFLAAPGLPSSITPDENHLSRIDQDRIRPFELMVVLLYRTDALGDDRCWWAFPWIVHQMDVLHTRQQI